MMEIKNSLQIDQELVRMEKKLGDDWIDFAEKRKWVGVDDLVKEMEKYDISDFPLREIYKKLSSK